MSNWFFPEDKTPVTRSFIKPEGYVAVGTEMPTPRPLTLTAARQKFNINSLPRQPLRQDSTSAQLVDLVAIAERLGMYDAADWVKAALKRG